MSLTRRLAAVAAPVLLVSTLSGCGGGGAPTDADPEAYCDAQTRLLTFIVENSTGGEPPSASETYDELQASVEEQEEVGTPEDMPDDARSAWEEQIDASKDVDEDDFTEAYESGDPAALEDEIADTDEEGNEALSTYNTDTCGNPLEELDVPTP